VLAGCCAPGQAQRPFEQMTAHTFASSHGELPYRLFAPAAETRPLPLVLFLHGAGERGSDNRAQLRHGVRAFLTAEAQAARPCVVAAPQCPSGVWWNVDQLLELCEELIALPGVDRDRFYVTGLSMGGYATWHLAGRRPDLFAAAVPVCGGGEVARAQALASLPIWAFHGAADRTVPVARSREMVEAIRRAGGEPKYTEYRGVGHDSWTKTYADETLHVWLFEQERRREPNARTADRKGAGGR
jgi:predicted peptidase